MRMGWWWGLALAAGVVRADLIEWTGGGTSNQWTHGANWWLAAPPVDGDIPVFSANAGAGWSGLVTETNSGPVVQVFATDPAPGSTNRTLRLHIVRP